MAQHWYCGATGEPRYTVVGKNGKERNTNVKDAREMNLVPSVTTIISLLAKNGLDKWLQTEAIKAAVEYPRWDGESEAEWLFRVLDLSKAKSREAAERGTRIHDILDNYFSGAVMPEWPLYVYKVRDALDVYFGENNWISEKSFVSNEGYGGKCDLHSNKAVIDFKTTEKAPGELTPYLEYNLQLAAYREVLAPNAVCANIYINGETNEIAVKIHDEQDIRDGLEIFRSLLSIFKIKNKLK